MEGAEENYNYLKEIIRKNMLHPEVEKTLSALSNTLEASCLEKMPFADLKLAIDPEFEPKVTLEKAKEYLKGA